MEILTKCLFSFISHTQRVREFHYKMADIVTDVLIKRQKVFNLGQSDAVVVVGGGGGCGGGGGGVFVVVFCCCC